MAKTPWGRKETIIWPRHVPIYTYALAFAVVVLTFVAVCVRIHLAAPLQRYYLPVYERTSVIGALTRTHRSNYQMLFVSGRRATLRPAMSADVVLGKTPEPGGTPLPLALSTEAQQQGYSLLLRGPKRSYVDARLRDFLKDVTYGGSSLSAFFRPPLVGGLILFFLVLPFTVRMDVDRQKRLRYGRRLKGPEMLTPRQFNRTVKGDGIGFKTDGMKDMLRIPLRAEAQHMQVVGDTGAGKSALLSQVLRQVRTRGDSAIVYDPAREYVKRFYSPERGDVILNPLDQRCPYWGPAEELRSRSEAKALAASLFQPPQDKKGEFFIESPQKIFAFLMAYGPTPEQLVDRLQWTAPSRDLGVANRDIGTIRHITEDGKITVHVHGSTEKTVAFDPRAMRHFDHGYAVTSHGSQGLTSDRVLINMDTDVHPELINTRFAYVSVSRASRDAQIFTNDTTALAESLSRDVSKASAVDVGKNQSPVSKERLEQTAARVQRTPAGGLGLAI